VPLSAEGPRSASVSLRELESGAERAVAATIRVHPRSAVAEREFLNVTAWQGGGSLLDPLEEVRPGVFRTTEPIPVHGGWKAMLRLQRGDALVGVPIFLPRDRGIPAPEVPATASFSRSFQADRELLQRERKEDVPEALTAAAYLTVLAIAFSLIGLIAWVLLRLEGGASRRTSGTPRGATTRASTASSR
jgi:hypothetical protein